MFRAAFQKGQGWKGACVDTSFRPSHVRWMFVPSIISLSSDLFGLCLFSPPIAWLHGLYVGSTSNFTWQDGGGWSRLLYPLRFKPMEKSERCLFRSFLMLSGWCACAGTKQWSQSLRNVVFWLAEAQSRALFRTQESPTQNLWARNEGERIPVVGRL